MHLSGFVLYGLLFLGVMLAFKFGAILIKRLAVVIVAMVLLHVIGAHAPTLMPALYDLGDRAYGVITRYTTETAGRVLATMREMGGEGGGR